MEDENERIEYTPNQKPMKGPSLWFIRLMLLLIAIGVLWIALQSPSSRVLVVEIHASAPKNSGSTRLTSLLAGETSDSTQVRNALRNGGMIRLENDNESYAELLGDDYYDYGAGNSDNYFFISGAALNYIASRGWTLVQAPESGAIGYYYFVRTRSRITEFITY